MVSRFFRDQTLLRAMGTMFDLFCAASAIPLAYIFRVGTVPEFSGVPLLFQVIFVVAAVICFYLFGLNRGSWRYASIDDLIAIIQSVAVAMFLAVMITFVVARLEMVPRTVPVLAGVLLVVMMGGARFVYRVFKDRYLHRVFTEPAIGEPVLLVGYTDEADAFVRAMSRQKHPEYRVLGIIDHTDRHRGRRLHKVRVLGNLSDLTSVIEAMRAENVLVSRLIVCPSKASVETMEQIVELAGNLGLQVSVLPRSGDLPVGDRQGGITPRDIRLEDLLGRPPAKIDLAPVAAMVQGKTILVTGGGGSIGSGLVMQIARFAPRKIVIVDNSEFNLYTIDRLVREAEPAVTVRPILADVRDRDAISTILARFKPELVFHAAALKHVPLVEDNAIEGARTNVIGTINVADAAVAHGALAFIMISTDKAVNPTNIMGATKRFAEAYCQSLDLAAGHATRFTTVRFGNVLGSAGSVVPLFTHQIARGGPVTVTHPEMTRYFMTIREAVKLVLSASARGMANREERGKILVLDMGKQVKIVDLAHRMIQLAGLRPDVDIKVIFTGLRPGEKLYEEPLEANERLIGTESDWLHIASPREVDRALLTRAVLQLATACEDRNEAGAVAAIRDIVPELVSTTRETEPSTVRMPTSPISLVDARSRLRR